MEPLLFALRYFTNLPLPRESRWDEGTAASSLVWLPFTGLVVGSCLSALAHLFIQSDFPQYPALRAVLIMAMELWIGGGLFLEGFSKSTDVLFFRPGTIRRLEVIGERYLGAKGVMGLIFVTFAKMALLAELSMGEDFLYMLVFYPCWSRWAFGFASSNYSLAQDEGMAFYFKIGQRPVYIMLSSCFMLAILLLMPRYFYIAALASFLTVMYCCSLIQTRLGGHTEETYGLASVAAELSLLFGFGISSTVFRYL